MATIDLTRSSTYFTKHYRSVRAQQGRILSDDDHNENERLHGEDLRRSRADLIGPAATPNGGFLISNPTVKDGFIDFEIAPGTLYLGGHRLELETKQNYQEQADWLNMDQWLDMDEPAMIAPPSSGKRLDFIAVEAYLQAASAVEDSELFEKAFGGVDTAARMRLMQRVVVMSGVQGADCSGGWQELVAAWAAKGVAVSPEHELVPDATLTVGFGPGSDPGDLCSPPVAGGYLRASNQAIRVQIIGPTELTWGFDNAAPLYRVHIDANSKLVHMQTPPKDQPHWPLSGQTVEILPWAAVLVNGEKLAEVSGFFTKVDSPYDPDAGQFSMVDALPAGFGEEWKSRSDEPRLARDDFFFLRVWDRGSDTQSPARIPFTAGNPVTLGQTGLTVTLQGKGFLTADHWIIAARLDAPDRVVPWSLEAGRGPHGIRRFAAALGMIEWDATGGSVKGTVLHDCRVSFPPVTRLRSCCTYTVGDGVTSFGMFTSIQQAIDQLPADGGEICILPGTYAEHLIIQDRRNIVIHGCDRFTILADDEQPFKPLITIADSQQITVKRLAIRATINTAILMTSDPAKEKNLAGLATIHIDNIHFSVRDLGAIEIDGGRFVRIRQNEIEIQPLRALLVNTSEAGRQPAIFSRASDVLIELNVVRCPPSRRPITALGGIQIGGGSERVDISRNSIEGGNGNGVTLGSFHWLSPFQWRLLNQGDYLAAFNGAQAAGAGFGLIVDVQGCIHFVPDPDNPKDPTGNPLQPVSDGDLSDIRIVDNEITGMGGNGIATIRLMSANMGLIEVIDCQIEQNRIRGCLQLEPPTPQQTLDNLTAAYGGVILAGVERLTLRNNWIRENGNSFIFPTCGVFIQFGTGVVIEGNQIEHNGPLVQTAAQPTAGARAGIYLNLVAPPLVSGTAPAIVNLYFEEGFPAARIANNVVIAPMGPALYARALGSVMAEANHFASHAVDPTVTGSGTYYAGSTVWIVNLGKASVMAAQKIDYAYLGWFDTAGTGTLLSWIIGPVLCNNNQVVFAPRAGQQTSLFASLFIQSGDDVSLEGNQSQCLSENLAVSTNAFVIALSTRTADNRFTEQPTSAVLSAFTIAAMNFATGNQGTHCFLIAGKPEPGFTVRQPNFGFATGPCDALATWLKPYFKSADLTFA